jgi:hypothetical protein
LPVRVHRALAQSRLGALVKGAHGRFVEPLVGALARRAQRNRYRLVPTPLFSTVFIETVTICNNDCSFCPISKLVTERKYQLMSETVFDRITSDLATIGYAGRIALYNNNDPLIDKRLPDLAALAHRRCPQARIQVMTNGILLTAPLARRLFDAGVHDLHVNNYDDSYRLIPSVARLVETFEGLETIHVFMRRKTQRLTNRAGRAPNAAPVATALRAFCTLPFRELNLAYDGRVPLCCADTGWEFAGGNVMESGVLGVWFGPALQRARSSLMKGRRDLERPCASCDHRGYKDVPARFLPLQLV